MIIKLNNQHYEVKDGTSLDSFIESIEISKNGIAIAIDFKIVPKDKWADTTLYDKQELILIHAVSGG